jgi:hypothetical protein
MSEKKEGRWRGKRRAVLKRWHRREEEDDTGVVRYGYIRTQIATTHQLLKIVTVF